MNNTTYEKYINDIMDILEKNLKIKHKLRQPQINENLPLPNWVILSFEHDFRFGFSEQIIIDGYKDDISIDIISNRLFLMILQEHNKQIVK